MIVALNNRNSGHTLSMNNILSHMEPALGEALFYLEHLTTSVCFLASRTSFMKKLNNLRQLT